MKISKELIDDLEIYDTLELKMLSDKITIELLKRKKSWGDVLNEEK